MVGIVSYGAYIPLWRVDLAQVGRGKGEKAVAGFDEDSVTMAVAAVIDCVAGRDRNLVEGLYFASTTSPYAEKQAATIVATATDLPTKLLTADVSDSLKAGTTAMRMAADAVAARSARQVLVVASDLRKASPGSPSEATYGDGAGALLLGNERVIAEIEGGYSVAAEITDHWRSQGEGFAHSGEDRFILSEGYLSTTKEAVVGLMGRLGLRTGDVDRLAISAPDARSHVELGRALGFDANTQLEDPLFGEVGATGAAHPLMILVAALEKARPGDRIIVAGYGNGADAISLVVTDEIDRFPRGRGMKRHLESKRNVDYHTYLYWRDVLPRTPASVRPTKIPSTTALWREQDQVLRFRGGRCNACGKVQFPAQRICSYCHAKDQFEPVRLSDRKAEIFTYSMDYIGGTKDIPLVVTVVDFEGGGRALLQMTDRVIEEIRVGLPVELSFRELRQISGIHNYFWKTVPVRA